MGFDRRGFLAAGMAAAGGALARPVFGEWQPSPRYPDPAIKILDPSFATYRLNLAKVERLGTGFRWCEGPVWFGDGRFLLWSDIPNNRILKWEEETGAISVFRKPSHNANGNTRDRQGRLLTCEHDTRRVTRTELDGTITVIADRHEGKPLNSPNDVVVKSDGTIWFTDPSYGHLQGFRPEPKTGDHVYRYNPASGELTAVADSLDKPNGLAFSPDERVLYIGDNGAPHHLLAFDVENDARLTGGRVLALSTPEHPDGLKTDGEGRIYASYSGGVQVLAPSGGLIGEINLPGAVNFTFGAPDGNTLFITTDTAVWAAVLNTKGA